MRIYSYDAMSYFISVINVILWKNIYFLGKMFLLNKRASRYLIIFCMDYIHDVYILRVYIYLYIYRENKREETVWYEGYKSINDNDYLWYLHYELFWFSYFSVYLDF